MFRLIFSVAVVFVAWCAISASELVNNEIVYNLLNYKCPGTIFPLSLVLAFFIVYRITFLFSHKRRC